MIFFCRQAIFFMNSHADSVGVQREDESQTLRLSKCLSEVLIYQTES